MQASIYPVAPFDANVGTTISFSWSGTQVFKNRCIIRNNETNEVVYDYTVDSFKLEHTIELSEATLVNGNKYDAYLTVFDKDGNESDLQSIPTTFLCLTTPVFQFTNCSSGQVLSSSSYTFLLEYSQDEGEELDSWSISVYNSSYILSVSSGIQYNTDELSYLFSGFTDQTEYYIRAEGKTINGYALDTGYIPLTVMFQSINIFSLFKTENLEKLGAIFVQANISALDGKTTNDPIYINGEYVDLRNDTLIYSDALVISGDFSIVVKCYNVVPNKPLLVVQNEDSDDCILTVYYRVKRNSSGGFNGYFELQVRCGSVVASYSSDTFEDVAMIEEIVENEDGTTTTKHVVNENQTKKVAFLILRNNGAYDIFGTVLDEEV